MSTYTERMADPAYAAHVRAEVAKAPPLTEDQLQHIASLLGLFVRPRPEHRKTGAPLGEQANT